MVSNRVVLSFLFFLLLSSSLSANLGLDKKDVYPIFPQIIGVSGKTPDKPHYSWVTSVAKISETEAELVMKVNIDKNWHLYSQYTPDGGAMPIHFSFVPSPDYQLIGKVVESKYEKKFEEVFGVDIYYFSNEAIFRQKIRVNSASSFAIKVLIEGQVCDDGSMCIPFDEELAFRLEGFKPKAVVTSTSSIDPQQIPEEPKEPVSAGKQKSPCVPCCCLDKDVNPSSAVNDSDTLIAPAGPYIDIKPLEVQLEPACGSTESLKSDGSLWGIFIEGMIGGLLALLTPCLFPMIPLTVSFFTKQSKDRKKGIFNAVLYGLSIIGIYVLLGSVITAVFGEDALNEMASNLYFNMLFFIVFIIFAISFFGAFEITLPNSFINKVDAASDRGGLIGIFFMAFTLALVSFSCTGPIVGTILVNAATEGHYLALITGMFGFSLALALPFTLFAIFPNGLNSLPKSGGWLNTVKVSLGFLEIILSIKFLSNVDLAYHWGFLKREFFIAIWIAVSLLWGLYLLGKVKLSHDSDMPFLSIPRMLIAIWVFVFIAYITPGLWGAPLKFFSGYLPPAFYSDWNENKGECPHDLTCFHDYEEGMDYARKHKKPVLLDFTGWSCVNCRRMEDKVWSQPQVLKMLANEYVLISLYVDDKEELPKAKYFKNAKGKLITTVGKKWISFESEKYGTVAQPYYSLLDNQGKILANPKGYTPNATDYLNFLKEGLCRYKARTSK